MLDYNLANAAGAVIGFEARGAGPRASTFPRRCFWPTPAARSTTRFSSVWRSACPTASSSTSPTRTPARRTRARRIRAARPAAASPTCRMLASLCRATSAISMRTTPSRTSTGRTASAEAGSGICQDRDSPTASGSPGSCRCSRACRTRSTRRSRSSGTSPVQRSRSRLRRPLSSSASDGRASAARSTTFERRRRPDRGGVQQERPVLADDSRGWLSRQSGLRQSRSQRAAGLLAAARRSQPGQELCFGSARNFEVRWDVFNVFNTVNYALPNNVIGGATTDFGKITDSVGGPRVMQFGARVRF